MKQIIAILLLILFTGCGNTITGNHTETQNLKIGAILPMTGSGAVWGEPTKNGMEIAKNELLQQGINIEIIYEDSQLNPNLGISAYNKLKQINKADAVIALASRIGIPLIPLAEQDQTPLIMIVTSAKGAADQSRYAFRYYSNEKGYVYPHFESGILENKNKIAILYVNDEYGVSIKDEIIRQSEDENIQVVSSETFEPKSTDFRSELTKIKSHNPDAILFVAATPTEATNILKQINELEINTTIIETSTLLSMKSARQLSGKLSENVYTDGFLFTLKETGNEFREKYQEIYNSEPTFASAFGHDSIMLLAKATNGKKLHGEQIAKNIMDLKQIDSLNGLVEIKANGEINPKLYSTQIVDGELELVR